MTDWNKEYRGEQTQLAECPLIAGEENADLLLDYCHRKLAPEMVEVFEQHMALCPACRAFAASQSAVWQALDAFEAMPLSEDFDERLFARIEREQRRASLWSGLWNRMTAGGTAMWRPAVPVAAAVVLAVGLWMRPGVVPPQPDLAKSDNRVDVEQVERVLEDMEMLRQLAPEDNAGSQHM